MTDDVAKEIREILDQGQPGKGSEKASININVGDIVNNQGTVVIGGNVNQGRREEDRPGAGENSHGRRASDRAVHQELRTLRDQLRSLKQLVTVLYERCPLNSRKRAACSSGTCPASSGSTGTSQPPVPNRPRSCRPRPVAAATPRKPAPRHTSRPVMSSLMPPNPTSPYVSYPLSPLIGQAFAMLIVQCQGKQVGHAA